MSMTLGGLIVLAAAELARHAPEIQRTVVDFVRENKHVIKDVVKGPAGRQFEENVKDTAQAALDYVNYNDDAGGWNKK